MKITMKASIECDNASCSRQAQATLVANRAMAPGVGQTFQIHSITLQDDAWWFKPTGSKLCALCPEHKGVIETQPEQPQGAAKTS